MDNNDFQKQFADAKKNRAEKSLGLPAGKYQAVMVDCFRNVSQNGQGRPQVVMCFKVQEGEYAEQEHRWFHGLNHPVALEILDATLERFGYDTSAIASEGYKALDPIIDDLKARQPLCVIALKQKGDFVNTNLSEMMGFTQEAGSDDTSSSNVPEEPDEEDGEAWEVTIGKKVKFAFNDAENIGEVVALDEEKGMLSIKVGNLTYNDVPANAIIELM